MNEIEGVKSTHRYQPRPSFTVFDQMAALLIAAFLLGLCRMVLGISGLDNSRRGRCERMRRNLSHVVMVQVRRQPSWLSGDQGVEEVRVPARVATLAQGQPLRRRHLRELLDKGVLKGVPVCAEQGPLLRADSYHYSAHVNARGQVTLRCRVHSW